ncbi:hypothetical protein B0H10DRAFT_2436898 [Mycena sp. CBHHK59/15]|nr:hypothetical protein B0H10DRAFT_2436898 [Mycena sp. CBHHK59/15]
MFTVVLIENPARVEANKYFMPNRDKMQSLYRAGNIIIIEILPAITPGELDITINDAFVNHPNTLSGCISL